MTVATEDYPPLSYISDGVVRGYSVEVAEEILRRAGIDYSLRIYPWARAVMMARRLPDVMIFSIVRTPQRERQYKWIGAIGSRRAYLYKLASRKDIAINSLSDLRNYKIGVNRNDLVEAELENMGFKAGDQIDFSNNYTQIVNKLIAGRIDFFIETELAMDVIYKNHPTALASIERSTLFSEDKKYYIAVSLSTADDRVIALRQALNSMLEDGFVRRVAEKYGVGHLMKK